MTVLLIQRSKQTCAHFLCCIRKERQASLSSTTHGQDKTQDVLGFCVDRCTLGLPQPIAGTPTHDLAAPWSWEEAGGSQQSALPYARALWVHAGAAPMAEKQLTCRDCCLGRATLSPRGLHLSSVQPALSLTKYLAHKTDTHEPIGLGRVPGVGLGS